MRRSIRLAAAEQDGSGRGTDCGARDWGFPIRPDRLQFPALGAGASSGEGSLRTVKIRSRWLNWGIAWLAAAALRALFATCRIVCLAPEPRLRLDTPTSPDDPERFILLVWHDALVLPTFGARSENRGRTCCLVSRHQDGGYLADGMAILGYKAVRGSSSRGGAQALKQLMADTDGMHIVITPDGPRGPRRQVKPGGVFLASQTGRRICCGAYVCRRGWRIRGSWTDLLIPAPFTTIYMHTSAPIAVPPDLARDELNQYVARVQEEMDRINAVAERQLAGLPPSAPAAAPPAARAAA